MPENAKKYDGQLLQLMRQRDALPKGDPRRKEIEEQIERIETAAAENETSVNTENPFQFYVVDSDVTEKLDNFMAQAEQDYAEMHGQAWLFNIPKFISLVDTKAPMDLKSQPGWEKPAYIYHGEIIEREDVGNINYGHFGTFCNIPNMILLFGAGVKQFLDNNTDVSYWITLFDDPRDTLRVLQGIETYLLQN